MEESMPEYVQRFINLQQKQLESEQIQRLDAQNRLSQQSGFSPSENQNLVEFQLDVKEILDRIYHMLSSHEVGLSDDGQTEIWVEPKDDRLKTLSDYGVKKIMEILQLYINPNTLLSCYNEETVMWKVRDFGIEISDLIFNKYEDFFYYPTPEDLFEKYKPIIGEQGLKISDDELYNKCVQWSNDELKGKLRHYPMIIQSLVDAVHSTYLRALNGEERESLRKQMHINQNASNLLPMPGMQQQKGGVMSRILPKKV